MQQHLAELVPGRCGGSSPRSCRKIPIIRSHPLSVGRASAELKPSRHPASMEIPDLSDFSVSDHGTIISIRPLNQAAGQWLDECCRRARVAR